MLPNVGGPRVRRPHVPVDLEALVRDAVWLHGSRVFETPHLDDLTHELDLAILALVEPEADHAVGDVLDESVAGGPRVLVLHFRREDAGGPRGLELLAEREQLLPPLLVIDKEHVQEADGVDRDSRRAAAFDEVRELGPDSVYRRLRVDRLELHDVELLVLEVFLELPSE